MLSRMWKAITEICNAIYYVHSPKHSQGYCFRSQFNQHVKVEQNSNAHLHKIQFNSILWEQKHWVAIRREVINKQQK